MNFYPESDKGSNFKRSNDSKQYEIIPGKISQKNMTTLMIRNIPNKFTKNQLLAKIDRNFAKAYDFFYLPIDFNNKCNRGYAFINFISLDYIKPFFLEFNCRMWILFNSEKICKINYARIQGKMECENHFKNSSLMKKLDQKVKPTFVGDFSSVHKLIRTQKQNMKPIYLSFLHN